MRNIFINGVNPVDQEIYEWATDRACALKQTNGDAAMADRCQEKARWFVMMNTKQYTNAQLRDLITKFPEINGSTRDAALRTLLVRARQDGAEGATKPSDS